jgi:membrane-associated phospholipid phosphatase
MQKKKKSIILLFFFLPLLCTANESLVTTIPTQSAKHTRKKRCKKISSCNPFSQYSLLTTPDSNKNCVNKNNVIVDGLATLLQDVIWLNTNIFSLNTFKIVTSFFPIYIGARMMDEPLQDNFFCFSHKKNIRQLPFWCHELTRMSLAVPIILLGSQAFLSKDPEFRLSGRMLLLGMPFVIFGKKLLKGINADGCLRPWHQDFYRKNKKRAGGGFPSGHMAQAVYVATLYGMRYGAKLAVPLSLLAIGIGAVFLNCNRHYFSQLVAGAALGTVYAYAANSLIDWRLSQHVKAGMAVDSNGSPGFKVSYDF